MSWPPDRKARRFGGGPCQFRMRGPRGRGLLDPLGPYRALSEAMGRQGPNTWLERSGCAGLGPIRRAPPRVAINLGTAASAFWIRTPWSLVPFFVHQLGEFAKYPITIYSRRGC